MTQSTSDLLRDNCDEFIYYEDLGQTAALDSTLNSKLPEAKRKVFGLLMESLLALRRENKEVLWSSMVKDTMKRKKPSFNEAYHGYRTFSELLEDAQKEGLLELDTDKRSRTYVVTRFGAELDTPPPEAMPARKRTPRRRRSGSRRRSAAPDNGASPQGMIEVRIEERRDEDGGAPQEPQPESETPGRRRSRAPAETDGA